MLKTPPLQTATATIDTLCGRLESATLLEDRRAAIQGLRSFAKQYPASVASGSLRELIATLKRDGLGEATSSESRRQREGPRGGDVDTIRLVLETLLMLFNPDNNSPEAGDEIAFFLADEFAMRQDNIILLLSLLDPTSPTADYYSRKHSLDILSAICAARPERLQECILSAPLGISRLVGVLDDGRDAVRNAGLLLLVDLTSGANEELRKIVAFEDVFGKVFAVVQQEGGLGEAGITAQDCLSLLANLIRGSGSNQTMFRESGCVGQLVQLLTQAFPPDATEAGFVAQSRERSTVGLLQLLRFFLAPGEASTPQNQAAFFRAGMAQILIDLSFSASLSPGIRVSALRCTAALIESNPPLQEQFAALTVITPSDAESNAERARKQQQTNGTRSESGFGNRGSARASADVRRSYIIEGLLELTLNQPEGDLSLRAASCGLVQAYLTNHDRIKAHFLQRATAGHVEHEEAANVLMALLHPSEGDVNSVVYASWIVQDLVANSLEAKMALTAVQEGNESEGEDVITAIQSFGSHLQSSLQTPIDERTAAAYASLLITLLWDFAPGVDNLLAEGSSLLQALVALVKAPSDPVVTGLAAMLLGTVYEFSTKDSPISRRTLAPLLQQKLGRTKYLDALLQLRRQPVVRDFDVDAESDEASDTLLSRVYVDLFMVEYSRLRKAIDKDPGVEVLPASASEAGVDRDLLDDLRQQIQAAKNALAQAQQEALEARQKADQDRMVVAKEVQTATAEMTRLQKINQGMLQEREKESRKMQEDHEQQKQTLEARHKHALTNARRDAEHEAQAKLREGEAAAAQKVQELERKIAELGNAHRTEQSGHNNARQQLESMAGKHNDLIKRERDLSKQLEDVQAQHNMAQRSLKAAMSRATSAEANLEQAKIALDSSSEEVEKLRSQIEELKDDVAGKEAELKTERAGFADLEMKLVAAKQACSAAEEKLQAAETGTKTAQKALEAAEMRAKTTEEKAKTAEKTTKDAKPSTADNDKLERLEADLKAAKEGQKTAEGKANAAEEKSKSAEKATKDAKASKADKEKLAKLETDLKAAKEAQKSAEEKLKVAIEKAVAASKNAGPAGKDGKGFKADRADQGRLAELEKQLKEAEASNDTARADREKLTTLENELKAAKEGQKSAQEDLQSALDELKAAEDRAKAAGEGAKVAEKATCDAKPSANDEKHITKLEADLKEVKESESSAKEELESMLLLMADIEVKRDAYREKVKELGGEVTDEEEDDEDDEDGDEDDDEE
ncbi:hypothetical protein DOTSEDRAFT_70332 [Dothistroma septosporum NZE10]|uniref:Uncharacterized protein n=1 Tax=Dothistroma septosporum (strain NZE10 / CBS 128990) TaxID=675120 RepID=N1PV66_DOTSN|nr:hypothetical protein DOTSEDRAFT_70332 [Dothistroma septosporum NZE10]